MRYKLVIYEKKIVLGIVMMTFLTACGGSSSDSGSNSKRNASDLPSSGSIDTGPVTPPPMSSVPDQPVADHGVLALSGGLHSIFSSSTQPILNFDLENNQILIALASPNTLKIIDVTDSLSPVVLSDQQFATRVTTADAGDYYDFDRPSVIAFKHDDDDDDDDDDDHGYSFVYPNSLASASLDVRDDQKIWAVVPFRTASAIEERLGIAYSEQYGVYTGDVSLLTAAGDNSDHFLRSMAMDGSGNMLAQTGYIQRTLQAENGRLLGWQIYSNALTKQDEIRIVELNSKAAVIAQSPILGWAPEDDLIDWAIDKDGERLVLVTLDIAGQYTLHLIDIKALGSASMNNGSLLSIDTITSSAEKVTDITFFNSSDAIAVSIANRVMLIDINQGSLVARSDLSFSDNVMGIESNAKRGFLAVLQGNSVELRSVENPVKIISTLDLEKEFTSLDMEENTLVVSTKTEYQMIAF
jgi:hypothetical protein